MEGDGTAWLVFSIVQIVTTVILIIGFSWLLIRMCRNELGSRFAKNLTALFLALNISIMVRFFCARYVNAQAQKNGVLTGFTDRLIQVIWLLAMLLSLLAFNLANWLFGFHYFKCAAEI